MNLLSPDRACRLLLAMVLAGAARIGAALPFDPADVLRSVGGERAAGTAFGLDQGEFLLTASPRYSPAPGSQGLPAVAFDGANYLVVWSDERAGDFRRDIFGARVAPDGTLLDSAGIAISTAGGIQDSVAVAFGSGCFLVVWQDSIDGLFYERSDIFGARVLPSGKVLDSVSIPIRVAPGRQTSPSVAWGAGEFLVAWRDWPRFLDNGIHATRVTPEGLVLDPTGISVAHGENWIAAPAVACGGAQFLVAWSARDWHGRDHIFAARLTPAGTVLDPYGFRVSWDSTDARYPSVASDGAGFLCVWRGQNSSVCGARVTNDGVALDTVPLRVGRASGYSASRPGVTHDGRDYLVAWHDWSGSEHNVFGSRITSGGLVLDTVGFRIGDSLASYPNVPVVASDGVQAFVAWSDSRGDRPPSNIFGRRVTQAGTLPDSTDFMVSLAASGELTPAVASDSVDFLMVWEDRRRDDDGDIFGARVSAQGVILDPDGIPICAFPGAQTAPAVAWNGSDYFVVWLDGRTDTSTAVYGARVTAGGAVLDSAGIPVYDSVRSWPSAPALAATGANALVVVSAQTQSLRWLYCLLVNSQGSIVEPGVFTVSRAYAMPEDAAVTAIDSVFFVVWRESRTPTVDIEGARVTAGGVVLDSPPLTICSYRGPQWTPAIASGGGLCLAVWEDERRSPYADIFGARVTPHGEVLDSFGICLSSPGFGWTEPDVVFDGTNYLAVWQDSTAGGDLFAAVVTSQGLLIDSFVAVRQPGSQRLPALARNADDQVLLGYQGWGGVQQGRQYNAWCAWGKIGRFPGAAERHSTLDARCVASGPTIVTNMLVLPASSVLRRASCVLLDIAGRKVLDLKSGPNDVSRLAPGVYFVREQPQAASCKPQAVRKVVIQR